MNSTRRTTRLRIAARFLMRSLDLRARSFLLALASVAVGVSVTAMALDLKADIGRKMSREMRVYGPNLIVTPRGTGAVLPLSAPGTVRGVLAGIEADATPLLYAAGSLGNAGAMVAGVVFDSARGIFPYWRVEGAWPDGGDERACLLGARLAARLKLGVGQTAPLEIAGQRTELTVSGLVTTGEAEDDQVFATLELVQRLAGADGLSTVALRLNTGSREIEQAALKLEASDPSIAARPLRQVSEGQGRLLGRLDLMMALLSALMLAMTVLCVITTLVSLVVERQPEIGLMRSLGAGDGEILLMLLGEATLMGLAGGLLGYGLGFVGARVLGQQLFGAAIAARPEVIPWVVALALVICWAGTLIPLRRALAIQPAHALRGE